MDKAYEDLPDGNIHRTFFVENLRRYMRGLRDIYAAHAVCKALHVISI